MRAFALEQIRLLYRAFDWVRDWSIAIDGGANIGQWAAAMAERFETVHAFEPNEGVCPPGRYILYTAALMNEMGSVRMTVPDKKRKNTRSWFAQKGGHIPAVTIDSLELPSCGLIKLDLEGAELLALEGAEQTVNKYKPVLILEIDRTTLRRYGHERGDLYQWLKAHRYEQVAEDWLDFVFVRRKW